ncbi:hypothetical protein PN462_04265 [Spirulina sp. CS-785/01]|uniref:SGNH/GDSL hydrolase family protein n=1 Tax=Spirulina sp. CS-785/01 TaxID=3021716 RepID=UPI00232E3530|nr:hypothetical protein [Spirulina sp. CS-785/01]MDB9312308.1 hypothetical protein [Spirulina sp. CS-785/01]
MKSFRKSLQTYSIITLITLGILETVFQVVQLKFLHQYEGLEHLYNISNRETYENAACDSGWWKWRFVQRYEAGKGLIKDDSLHRPHPSRGWTPQANLSVKINGNQYTTNSQGQRDLEDYQPNPDQYTVLIVGNSYTFGLDTDDSFVWPTLLENLDSRLNVINLGVSGYGLDQIYITLKETLQQYPPDLVIVAFISDDIFRMRFDFRDYKKPKLKIQNGQLKITNVPIKGLEQTYKEIKNELVWYDIPILKLDNVISNLKISCQEVSYQLASKVFRAMQRITKENNAAFLLTYLASFQEVETPDHISYGEKVFKQFVQEEKVAYLNTRPFFLARNQEGENYQGGHYQEAEARLVSQQVYQKIQNLPSWQNFLETRKGF